jgi:hypothetical protein
LFISRRKITNDKSFSKMDSVKKRKCVHTNSKKRKWPFCTPAKKRSMPTLTIIQAMDRAGFVAETITKLMKYGATYPEALVQTLSAMPDSLDLCRQFETFLSNQMVDEKQQLQITNRLQRLPSSVTYVVKNIVMSKTCVYNCFHALKRSVVKFCHGHETQSMQIMYHGCQMLCPVQDFSEKILMFTRSRLLGNMFYIRPEHVPDATCSIEIVECNMDL